MPELSCICSVYDPENCMVEDKQHECCCIRLARYAYPIIPTKPAKLSHCCHSKDSDKEAALKLEKEAAMKLEKDKELKTKSKLSEAIYSCRSVKGHDCVCIFPIRCQADQHDCICGKGLNKDCQAKEHICVCGRREKCQANVHQCVCVLGMKCNAEIHSCVCLKQKIECNSKTHDCCCDPLGPHVCRKEEEHACICYRFNKVNRTDLVKQCRASSHTN